METTNEKMTKKKIVITLSRVFPTTHSRKGQPTGFKEKLASGRKMHTIRGNYDQWAAIAEKMQRGGYCLSIRQWSGARITRRRSKLPASTSLSASSG